MDTPTSDDGNIDYNNVYSSKVLFIHSSPRRPLLHSKRVAAAPLPGVERAVLKNEQW